MSHNFPSEYYISSVNKILIISIIAFVSLFACGPKPGGLVDLPVPFELRSNTISKRAALTWSVDRTDNRPTSGYNIYVSEKSLAEIFDSWTDNHPDPYNFTPFPGDTDGDKSKETFELTNLDNGKTYYISVRTVGLGGIESPPSNEISITPLAKGSFLLSTNHMIEAGGFCFENENSVPSRDPRCDIYLYSKNDIFGLSSPNRLGAGFRKSKFSLRRTGVSDAETVKIRAKDKVIVKTKYGQAELIIKNLFTDGISPYAQIDYIFYPK